MESGVAVDDDEEDKDDVSWQVGPDATGLGAVMLKEEVVGREDFIFEEEEEGEEEDAAE